MNDCVPHCRRTSCTATPAQRTCTRPRPCWRASPPTPVGGRAGGRAGCLRLRVVALHLSAALQRPAPSGFPAVLPILLRHGSHVTSSGACSSPRGRPPGRIHRGEGGLEDSPPPVLAGTSAYPPTHSPPPPSNQTCSTPYATAWTTPTAACWSTSAEQRAGWTPPASTLTRYVHRVAAASCPLALPGASTAGWSLAEGGLLLRRARRPGVRGRQWEGRGSLSTLSASADQVCAVGSGRAQRWMRCTQVHVVPRPVPASSLSQTEHDGGRSAWRDHRARCPGVGPLLGPAQRRARPRARHAPKVSGSTAGAGAGRRLGLGDRQPRVLRTRRVSCETCSLCVGSGAARLGCHWKPQPLANTSCNLQQQPPLPSRGLTPRVGGCGRRPLARCRHPFVALSSDRRRWRQCEVRAEDYAFVLLSRFINSVENKVRPHLGSIEMYCSR